jgi:hypothetical protein
MTGSLSVPDTSIFLDTSIPNMSRIFDYLVGGTANFEVDRQAAAEMLKIMPSLRKWVRLRRAFIQEAAHLLHQEGFKQFLDLGSGMPSENHIHAFVPDARIIYSDLNPVAVSYGNSLFADLSHVDYIRGNAHDPAELLMSPEVNQLINRDEKVAIGLNALVLFLSEDEIRRLAQKLYEWAPSGSKLFLVIQTRGNGTLPDTYQEFLDLCRAAYMPIKLYTFEQNVDMLHPWHPGFVESLTSFLTLPDDFLDDVDKEGIDMAFYAAFMLKE